MALVEQVFRRSKTVQWEMRPVYVRKESRTRGHAFVVMLPKNENLTDAYFKIKSKRMKKKLVA